MTSTPVPAIPDADRSAPMPPPTLQLTSRLNFRPLTIVPDGDDVLVGDAASATFLAIPPIGVVALQELQAGRTIAEATATASAQAGEPVDVLDFATVLLDAGLVMAVDGVPLAAAANAAERSWLAGVRPEWVRPFFSAPAWVLYVLLLLFCLSLFVAQPQYWPDFEDWFFYPDPAVCVVVMTLVGLLLAACHEVFHWLAGRAAGVAARFSISRRLFFPVFETDLSQLRGVPRRQRYSPFLAGMAFDTVILTFSLGLRVLWGHSVLDVPPLLYRLLGAVVLLQVLGLGWQVLVFLRTDLYAVLITALGCYDLSRINFLLLKRWVARLSPREETELANVHHRDLQVARWFRLLYLAGVGWASYIFVTFFIPSTVMLAGWMFGSLGGAPLGSVVFWEALVIGLVAGAQGLLPLLILLWQRRKRVA